MTTVMHGVWGSKGEPQYRAILHLTSTDPIVGTIDVGECTANWIEIQRISPKRRLVRAHVTSGPCEDNTWDVTIEPGGLHGVDTEYSTIGVDFSDSDASRLDA
ncbi:hypothetical protein ACVWWN_003380 [Mycobacterium sp. URHB0021]|jgi:hypothetical protein